MLLKLALRNIQRSVRDYTVYFVTLLVAVMIFYAFNSVNDQKVMADIAASAQTNIVELTGYVISLFSIVVAIVFGFLVIYSNQLLVSRRKREFGIYLTLGMKPGQVSHILLYETIFVGILSLAGGLILGVLVSQLLSFATAALYGISMPDYQFTFSLRAFVLTLACFAAIYIVVAAFNVISIRRRKLIDLINAGKTSQKVVIQKPWICLVIFACAIAILAYGYQQLAVNGMTLVLDDEFKRATIAMLCGTLLLFFSLSGFMLAVLTRAKGVYLRKLVPFTTRQVTSKINTSFLSVWIVCVLLFFAITTFATGMALVDAFVKDIAQANPYDASIYVNQSIANSENTSDERDFDITQAEAYLQEHFKEWDEIIADASTLTVYTIPTATYGDAIEATGAEVTGSSGYIDQQHISATGLSQFNDALRLQGKNPITLSDGEYLVTNNMAVSEDLARAMVDTSFNLKTPVATLLPADEVYAVQLGDNSMLSNGVTVVLPDDVFEALDSSAALDSAYEVMVYLNVAFAPETNAEDIFIDGVYRTKLPGITNAITRDEMVSQSMGLRMLISYLALYIGLVLLVAVAAVLAIQLLSLTIDSLGRYRTLLRLGCDMNMLGRSLFAQVTIYFLLPLAVAVCHSSWVIHIMTGTLFDSLGLNLLPTILMSAAFVLVIYGGYMLVTYLTSRATIKQGIKEPSMPG